MFNVDVAVVGGGIQGLVVLRAMLAQGCTSVLITNAPLGAGQTLHSHGALISGIGLVTGGLWETVETVTAPYLRRLGMDVRGSPAFLALPDPMVSQLAPLWRANRYSPGRGDRSDVAGLEPTVPPYRVTGYSVDKRRLVETLSAGLDPHIIGGEVLRADEVLHVRTADGEDVWLRPGAVVVAAGCGTKALLRERFGIEGGVVNRITYSRMHMLCLEAPAGVLPEFGALVTPDLFVAAHQHSPGGGVTWLATPVDSSAAGHQESPADATAAVDVATVAAGIQALRRVVPALRQDDARVRATVFAGYKQDLDGEPLKRLCELVDRDRRVVVALPSVLANAVPNALDAVAMLAPRVSGARAAGPARGARGGRVGVPEEERRDDWREWTGFVRTWAG